MKHRRLELVLYLPSKVLGFLRDRPIVPDQGLLTVLETDKFDQPRREQPFLEPREIELEAVGHDPRFLEVASRCPEWSEAHGLPSLRKIADPGINEAEDRADIIVGPAEARSNRHFRR